MIFNEVAKFIFNTPIWVWIILVIMIKRGLALRDDGVVSIKKALINPSIFIVWGIEKIMFQFSYPFYALIFYFSFLLVGSILGYFLYSSTQKYYQVKGVFMRKGSTIQLWVVLINFILKYSLNIAMNITPDLLKSVEFNSIYSIISGITAGLFIGGFVNMLLKRKCLMNDNELV